MACSKIFSGDLPEITSEILEHLRNDFSTLYSCILVNRLLCRTAIPLLWENPFSIPTQNCHFIEIYLHYLNESDKTKLDEIGFNSNLIPSNPLFNYPNFIKCLNTFRMVFFIEKWTVRAISTYKKTNNSYTYSSAINFKKFSKLIYSSLFNIFINNEVKLNIFETEIITDKNYEFFENVIEIILQNPNFIYNIKNLKLHIYNISDVNLSKINSFLTFLSSNCNNISSLYLRFQNMFIKTFSHIINSQQNLQKISFSCNIVPLHLLLSLKNSNYSNTLKTIVFYSVDFKNTVNLTEVFEQLNVLESIHILYCHSLNSIFVQQIINLSKPFKLKSLFTSEIFPIESFQLLLQKSGDYLENIGFESLTNSNELLLLIKTYCTKISIFELRGLDNQNTHSALNLIKNVSLNLNCLFIDNYSNYDDLSSIILRNLGKILPSRLEYLNLSFKIKLDDFKIFLKDSQNIFIKRLLIRNRMFKERVNILPYIKEYIMKNRRVEYLAIDEILNNDKKELYSLKDEVKEFGLYNIKVQSYDNLNICCYKYIRDI
ncbi:hypothetical protein RhiirA1_536096 [Rhizophagus irregularis]|uniref:F-box domain-containing protein n=1 Tax=Rhizophagus irregularis TaxID=588596 RepID=A0A2N0RR15_9GLOM|nr:hypothetical protein RhiirA1_536096 [Rhizophagus irregularis]CAB5192149.1 unnamed protein product [Rhizophagus irregularis]